MRHVWFSVWGVALGCTEYALEKPLTEDVEPTTTAPTSTAPTPTTEPDDGAPDIEVEPAQLDFAAAGIGCEVDQVLTIRNVGTEVLTIGGVSVSGDTGYVVAPWDGPLAPGETIEVVVTLDPESLGSSTAEVKVVCDDPDEPIVDVPALGETSDGGLVVDSFVQNGSGVVDVLWVIDNSGSMSEKQDSVASSIQQFFVQFEQLGLDYHMGVVTTDTVAPTESGQLQGSPTFITSTTPSPQAALGAAISVGDAGSGDENGLLAMELALTEPLLSGGNAGFYRPDALLSVIVLSDENEFSNQNAAHYINFLEGLKADPALVTVSAIVAPQPIGCFNLCAFQPREGVAGAKYIDVQTHFNGVFGSVCDCSYANALTSMGWTSAGFRERFVLAQVPLDPALIEVVVNGAAETRWTWDALDNAVVFDAAAIPPAFAAIDATYTIAGECP